MAAPARKLRLLFWAGALAFPFVLIGLLDAALGPGPGIAPEFRYAQAEAVESAADSPVDLPSEGWEPTKLPGHVPRSTVRPSSGWFRLQFSAANSPEEFHAVYFEQPYSNLAVFVNGVAVGLSGPMTRPIPMHRTPLMFTFPSRLLQPGANTLHVRSLEADYLSRLDRAAIGPLSRIAPAFEFSWALHATYKQISVVVLCVLGVLFVALWLLRRRETGYAWFALGLFAWAAHIQIGLIARSPVMPEMLWTCIRSLAIGVFAIAAAMFVNRHTNLEQPRVERILLAFGALGAAFLIAGPAISSTAVRFFVPHVWMPGLTLVSIYSLAQLLRALARRPGIDILILLACTWLLLVVGVHDLLIETGTLAWSPLYMSYTVGFVLCAISAVLLHRFALAFDAAERARDELDERVRLKSAELEANLGRMKDLERERALGAERERILQDMHDGLGGHLVQALAIATSREQLQPLEEPLRTCLEELRLMVDSLEPANGDLASVLGSLRPRVSRRLALAGVQMRWQIDDLPSMPDLGPRKVLDVARVVQEAITNAIKHSGCNQILVGARRVDERIEIRVEDNGCGLRSGRGTGNGAGHGLASMQRRAAALGGELTLAGAAPGTCVTLSLPFARADTRNEHDAQSHDRAQASPVTPAHS